MGAPPNHPSIGVLSIINQPFLGTPIYGNPYIYIYWLVYNVQPTTIYPLESSTNYHLKINSIAFFCGRTPAPPTGSLKA